MAALRRELRVFSNLEALTAAATVLVIDAARRAIAERDRFLWVLSGGTTPLPVYQLLAGPIYSGQLDWSRVHVFWGDERCLSPQDPENNYKQARDSLLGNVPLPPKNIHRIESELDPLMAASNYVGVLKEYASAPMEWPSFDLVLLGMGDDGHTASLFPGSDPKAPGPAMAVTAEYQDRPSRRVTLTANVFNSAREIAFLVSGKSKSEVLASVLFGEYRPQALPAQRIRPVSGDVLWMLDQAAANPA
jgi:6-phosphogluconolactonase